MFGKKRRGRSALVLAIGVVGSSQVNASLCSVSCVQATNFIFALKKAEFSKEQQEDFSAFCRSFHSSAIVATVDREHEVGTGRTFLTLACIKTEDSFLTAHGYGSGDLYEARQQARESCRANLPKNSVEQVDGYYLVGSPLVQEPDCNEKSNF